MESARNLEKAYIMGVEPTIGYPDPTTSIIYGSRSRLSIKSYAARSRQAQNDGDLAGGCDRSTKAS